MYHDDVIGMLNQNRDKELTMTEYIPSFRKYTLRWASDNPHRNYQS